MDDIDQRFKHWADTILRNGGPAFLYADVQYGKTFLELTIAHMARSLDMTPIILTQPDLLLRQQGHDSVDDAVLKSNLNLGGHLKFEDCKIASLKDHVTIFDIMQVKRASEFSDHLEQIAEEQPHFFLNNISTKK